MSSGISARSPVTLSVTMGASSALMTLSSRWRLAVYSHWLRSIANGWKSRWVAHSTSTSAYRWTKIFWSPLGRLLIHGYIPSITGIKALCLRIQVFWPRATSAAMLFRSARTRVTVETSTSTASRLVIRTSFDSTVSSTFPGLCDRSLAVAVVVADRCMAASIPLQINILTRGQINILTRRASRNESVFSQSRYRGWQAWNEPMFDPHTVEDSNWGGAIRPAPQHLRGFGSPSLSAMPHRGRVCTPTYLHDCHGLANRRQTSGCSACRRLAKMPSRNQRSLHPYPKRL